MSTAGQSLSSASNGSTVAPRPLPLPTIMSFYHLTPMEKAARILNWAGLSQDEVRWIVHPECGDLKHFCDAVQPGAGPQDHHHLERLRLLATTYIERWLKHPAGDWTAALVVEYIEEAVRAHDQVIPDRILGLIRGMVYSPNDPLNA